jgi:hypothetical protein
MYPINVPNYIPHYLPQNFGKYRTYTEKQRVALVIVYYSILKNRSASGFSLSQPAITEKYIQKKRKIAVLSQPAILEKYIQKKEK